ncbi:MAG TPA: aminotransferase class III-fold pyridoxal phosphate-dependent enzyme [Nocardioidaceae bacterium]|nr:aminotransferase class III-fold pyridoxal phosphate-dependent enzyme [Nocardioidaceae bacterium]
MGALWHPFSDMGAVERDGEFVLTRGDGVHVWDEAGRKYLDATAGLWFTNVGHGRREIADTAAAQLRSIAAYSTFGDFAVDTTIRLADRLAGMAPVPDSKIFLTSGGSDSVETAAKLARRYWHQVGRPERVIILGREKAYHGMHVAGTALAGIPANREGHGELMADAATVRWDSADDLAATIERLGPERIAAFFCEPVIGAGGVYPPPDGYLAEVRQVCREHDILFVSDEVVTGFGRIGGSWFASSRFGLEPDMVTTAKGLTSGYLPMGAVFIAPRLAEPFFQPDAGVWWRHGYTYSGHAGAAAVALANLDIIERESLLDESARLEKSIASTLAALAEHPAVSEVRSGTGAVAAVQLHDASLALGLAKGLRRHGISTRAVGAGAIQVSPAFVMTDQQVSELADGIRAGLDELQ